MMKKGFTLIELSIVLVIIGLIVGGVLVGRDLIAAAEIRAQISQFEKFTAATNTFRVKYGYLPGDIPDPAASSFGFKARATTRAGGDGNGQIEGDFSGGTPRMVFEAGETALFWVDLSYANLIPYKFSIAQASTASGATFTETSATAIKDFMPTALINGNYVYVYSPVTFISGAWRNGGYNAFAITGISSMYSNGNLAQTTRLTVNAAYNIDQKMDDGLPQTGKVQTNWPYSNNIAWIAGNGGTGAPVGGQVAGDANSCYDNNNVASATMSYSLSQNGGNGLNCALTIKF